MNDDQFAWFSREMLAVRKSLGVLQVVAVVWFLLWLVAGAMSYLGLH